MITQKNNKKSIHWIFLYAGIVILLISKFAKLIRYTSSGFLASNGVYLAGVVVVLIGALFSGVTFAEGIVLICALINFFCTRDTTLLSFIALIIAVQPRDTNNLIRTYMHVNALILGVCIFLYFLLHAVGSPLAALSYIDGRSRYNFFFTHPNNAAAQLTFTIFAFIYLYRNKIPYWLSNIILTISALFIYFFPNSQTATILVILYMVIRFGIRYARKFSRKVFKYALPIALIVVVLVVYAYATESTELLSQFITGTFEARFTGATVALKLYHLTLLGSAMPEIGTLILFEGEWMTFWLDMAYVRVIFACGIVGTIVFISYFAKGIRIHLLQRNFEVLALLVIVLVYAMSEWTALSVTTVFPLLFLKNPRKKGTKIYRIV